VVVIYTPSIWSLTRIYFFLYSNFISIIIPLTIIYIFIVNLSLVFAHHHVDLTIILSSHIQLFKLLVYNNKEHIATVKYRYIVSIEQGQPNTDRSLF